jgi:hypothetical protein
MSPGAEFSDNLNSFSKILHDILGTVPPIESEILRDYTGKIHLMALDTYSCKILQNILEMNNVNVTNKIYDEIIDNVATLMCDPIGNYLCQKLMGLIDEKQRLILLINCKSSLVSISNNLHGTRSIQKLLDVIQTDDEFAIIREEFQDHVIEMIHDLNGNHVIKKCIQRMSPQFIYDVFILNCVEVATSIYGCCILNAAVDCGTINQKVQLIDAIGENSIPLIQHPYGNYVVQHILNLKLDPNFPTKIVKRINGQVYNFSKQKISSNVIEKCFLQGNSDCVKRLMNELLFNPNLRMSGSKIYSPDYVKERARIELNDLLQDSFGNYVVQTCLNVSKDKTKEEYKMMIDLLRPIFPQLKFTPYGRKFVHHFTNM